MEKRFNQKLQNSQRQVEFVAYAELFPELTRQKTRDRAISILEAAIECYRTIGIENTTYERISEKAGVSRPLVFKYFADYDEIFYQAVKLIRVHFQVYAVEAIRAQVTPTDKLRAYTLSTFEWLQRYPSYASGLLLYLQRCSWKERDRDLNTQFTEAGRNRIAALVRLGVEAREFTTPDPDMTAKQIQTVLTGSVVTSLSETLAERGKYERDILALCLGLVGVKIDSE